MSISTSKRALVAALTTLDLLGASSLARADINDYEFQLVEKEIKQGNAILSVRLVHKPDGKSVPDAVIFATRLDMAPDSMAEMQTSIAPMPSTEPGVYRFKVLLTMAGGWRLSLGAKIQGEAGTLENELVLKAVP
jgi:YtkA-like